MSAYYSTKRKKKITEYIKSVKCEYCGCLKGELRYDQYLGEIHDIWILVVMCADCHEDKADEI